MQIAIGNMDMEAALWCEHEGVQEDGGIKFYVINGAWGGILYPDRDEIIVIHNDGNKSNPVPGKLCWQGKAPFHSFDYNEALDWIRGEVIKNGYRLKDYIYMPEPIEESEDDDIPF